jgi:Zn-dependent peptidase ImmA (M78 family)
LRRAWELGQEPSLIFSEILEEKGIKVIALPLEDAVSGVMCFVRFAEDRVPVIVVNSKNTGERQRFTLAHELGHLVLDVHENIDEEKAAHRFASAFLMPAEELLAEVGRHRKAVSLGELFELKKIFGVSVQAIAYRCKDLGILGPKAAADLFATFTRLGWRSPPYNEPHPVEREQPARFKRLCFRALAEGMISDSKAAELLAITVRQLNREMEGPRVEA